MDDYLEELEAAELAWFMWTEQDHQAHVEAYRANWIQENI